MRRYLLLVALGLALAACGTSQGDRALSGGGIGAGAGAAVGAVTGLSLLQGAVLGGGAGVAAGLLTDPDDVNLGTPFWRRGSSGTTASTSVAHSSLVANAQSGLIELGYDPGPVDGVMGPRTSAAIREYQYDHGLPLDGQATPALEQHILAQTR